MPKRTSSLQFLAEKLLARRVPSLTSLVAQISDAESYAEFVKLVNTYLPEHERVILHETTPMAQMSRFASFFEDRYFPLEESIKFGAFESYADITPRIPVVVMGLSYDDYHEMHDYRPGAQLMTLLIESPWDEDDISVSLAEACSDNVPDELVERAGRIRLSPEDAHRLLKDTKYEPLALWADRLHYNTGNFFLDTDYEMLWSGIPPDWDPDNVEELTRLWQQAQLHDNKTGKLMDWLEEDLVGNFEELVTFIEERR
ncbi:MAG: hypothetical protein ACETVS_03105 [Dehalococcoidales bacterium]